MFLGLSREHRLSSTEMDEVLAKDRLPHMFAGILVGQRVGRRLVFRGTVE